MPYVSLFGSDPDDLIERGFQYENLPLHNLESLVLDKWEKDDLIFWNTSFLSCLFSWSSDFVYSFTSSAVGNSKARYSNISAE